MNIQGESGATLIGDIAEEPRADLCLPSPTRHKWTGRLEQHNSQKVPKPIRPIRDGSARVNAQRSKQTDGNGGVDEDDRAGK